MEKAFHCGLFYAFLERFASFFDYCIIITGQIGQNPYSITAVFCRGLLIQVFLCSCMQVNAQSGGHFTVCEQTNASVEGSIYCNHSPPPNPRLHKEGVGVW